MKFARCKRCDADLHVPRQRGKEANVHCSNERCAYYREPYPVGKEVNVGVGGEE